MFLERTILYKAIAIAFASVLFLSCAAEEEVAIPPLGTMEGPKGEQVRILFGGDTAFAESYGEVQRELLREKGYDYPIAKLKRMIMNSEFVICNLETPLTGRKDSPYHGKKAYVHWTNVGKAVKAYKKNHLLTFSLANNHALDYGMAGLEETIKIMERTGISWFGAGRNEPEAKKPLLRRFNVGGRAFNMAVIGAFEYWKNYDSKYAFYAENERGGCYRLSSRAIRTQIANLKSDDPDIFVVVFPHWGRNYAWKTDAQTKDGRAFIESGADLVIGHGAHGMQEIERYQGKWILYGLGNFVFLTSGRYKKEKYPTYSYTAQIILSNHSGALEKWIRLYPICSNNLLTGFQPRPLTDPEFEDFIKILVRRSALSHNDVKCLSRGRNEIGQYLQSLLPGVKTLR